MITAQLINVGREKVNKVVHVEDEQALLREVKRYLASSIVELVEREPDKFEVQVGGLRTVGQVNIATQIRR